MSGHEIEAAAERDLLAAISDCEGYCRGVYRDISRATVEKVAKALRDRLAADRAEREERARPIDAEWFQEHGNDIGSLFVCRGDIEYELEWAAGTPGIGIDLTVYSGPRKCFCHSVHLPHVVTRGQLLDLLRVLKGGAE